MDGYDMPSQLWTVYNELRQQGKPGGWRTIGDMCGVSGSYAREIALGRKPVTPLLARRWLERTQQIVQTVVVSVCPDCGNVHTGRCHGRPVAAVVCLAPDETVRPVAKRRRSPRPPAHRPYITDAQEWQDFQAWRANRRKLLEEER